MRSKASFCIIYVFILFKMKIKVLSWTDVLCMGGMQHPQFCIHIVLICPFWLLTNRTGRNEHINSTQFGRIKGKRFRSFWRNRPLNSTGFSWSKASCLNWTPVNLLDEWKFSHSILEFSPTQFSSSFMIDRASEVCFSD